MAKLSRLGPDLLLWVFLDWLQEVRGAQRLSGGYDRRGMGRSRVHVSRSR